MEYNIAYCSKFLVYLFFVCLFLSYSRFIRIEVDFVSNVREGKRYLYKVCTSMIAKEFSPGLGDIPLYCSGQV